MAPFAGAVPVFVRPELEMAVVCAVASFGLAACTGRIAVVVDIAQVAVVGASSRPLAAD